MPNSFGRSSAIYSKSRCLNPTIPHLDAILLQMKEAPIERTLVESENDDSPQDFQKTQSRALFTMTPISAKGSPGKNRCCY